MVQLTLKQEIFATLIFAVSRLRSEIHEIKMPPKVLFSVLLRITMSVHIVFKPNYEMQTRPKRALKTRLLNFRKIRVFFGEAKFLFSG